MYMNYYERSFVKLLETVEKYFIRLLKVMISLTIFVLN